MMGVSYDFLEGCYFMLDLLFKEGLISKENLVVSKFYDCLSSLLDVLEDKDED